MLFVYLQLSLIIFYNKTNKPNQNGTRKSNRDFTRKV